MDLWIRTKDEILDMIKITHCMICTHIHGRNWPYSLAVNVWQLSSCSFLNTISHVMLDLTWGMFLVWIVLNGFFYIYFLHHFPVTTFILTVVPTLLKSHPLEMLCHGNLCWIKTHFKTHSQNQNNIFWQHTSWIPSNYAQWTQSLHRRSREREYVCTV